jgi:hypothetical protein
MSAQCGSGLGISAEYDWGDGLTVQRMRTELIWEGKDDKCSNRRKLDIAGYATSTRKKVKHL